MSPERRRPVEWQGTSFEAVDVPYRAEGEEPWTTYLLDDGTVLRSKTVVTGVERIEGAFDEAGDPMYFLRTTQVISVSAPAELRRPS